MIVRRLSASLAACLLAASLVAPSFAQEGPAPGQGPRGGASERGRPAEARPEGRRLPADVTTEHRLDLPGRSLAFTATAGALTLTDPAGAVQAELGYVAYRLKGGDPASRPVTFAVNGGPGAASAYLHLLVAGPWRLPLDGPTISPSAPPVLVPNAETWLDFTDLVFLDPVGTGYSRANGSESDARARYWSVGGDIASLSAAMARWLRQNDRLASPKFFLGESYGGFRGPLLAEKLQSDVGIGLSGLVLLSPVLDFAGLGGGRHQAMEYVNRLPSLAAAALERKGAVTREALAEAERYASGEYLLDLVRGPNDREALARLEKRVAELTGIDPAIVARHRGRLDLGTLSRELRRDEARVTSLYDTGVTAFDPDPGSGRPESRDAVLGAMKAPLTTAAVDLLWRRLDWRVPNARYELLNDSVAGRWRYESGRLAPESLSELRQALALDSRLRVLVAHGLTDLVTPYFGSELLLRQVPAYGGESRVRLASYPGGHMFYTRDGARAAFRADAEALYREALRGRGAE